jgi:glycosyltransferase involved in cell wall biosynthesis
LAFDSALAIVTLALSALLLLPKVMGFRLRRLRRRPGTRRIAYLGTGQIAQVFPRNGVNLFLERECSDFDGYFEQMWNLHFPAGTSGALDLTPHHHLLDFDLKLPVFVGRFKRTAMALRERAFLRWAIGLADREGITVLCATNPHLQGINAFLLGRLLGLPYAVIVTRDWDWDWQTLRKQGMPSVFPSRQVEERVEHLVFSRAALVLADRQFYRNYAVRHGARPQRAVATRVMADSAYARATPDPDMRRQYGLGPGPILAYVGRLDADKLIMDVVECFGLIRQHYPTAQLLCAGSGDLAGAMRTRAQELGIEEGLHLLEPLALEPLSTLVASSDVVVAAHMGYTLIEAGLTGVPIVTYDYDFHPEILQGEASAYLAPLGDTRALAERVCSVLADPESARRAGQRTRERLLDEHSMAKVVPLYQQAYERFCGT